MKKIFTLFLALVATTALWAEDFEVDGIYYNILSNNEVEVTYRGWYEYSNEYSGSVTIPSTVTYNGITYSVTSIGWDAFYKCTGLTSVTIPNSVTSIGDEAFYECSGLTSITIPNSVTSIGWYAFRYCFGLTSITIPNSVTSIGEYAFSDCSSLPVENNLRYADTYLVEAVDRTLSTYSIKEGTKWIGSSAFAYCSSLTSITIPNSVTSIGGGAFEYCSGLTSITIPNSVTSIGSGAFTSCSSLTSLTIPNSVTSIGDRAFRGCSGLTSPVYNAHCFAYMPTSYGGAYAIPEGIKQIAGGAFNGCYGLIFITIPNSVTSIGDYAFDDTAVYNNKSNWESGVLYISNCLIAAQSNISGTCTIKDGTRLIADWAFALCRSLTSITIPNSVTSIGRSAFNSCSGLTSVTIGNSVTSIGDGAFASCSSLTSLTIPNSVTSIGRDAFRDCSGLTSITIGNSVTSIGDWAFRGCYGLTSINVWAEVPPTLGSSVFTNVSKSIPVYVPSCGSVSAYQSAEGWKAFTNIQGPLAEYSIAVGVNDNKMGTAKVDENTICGAQISATANYGYYFTQWSDGITENPRTLVLTQDTTLTAEFAPNQYAITTTSSQPDRGTTRGDTMVNYLEYATLSAEANYGYHFASWNDYNYENPRRVQVIEDQNYAAYFYKNTYYITKNYNSEQGYINGVSSAEYLDLVTLTAIPNYGYHFTQWSDGETDNPRTLVLTQDTILTAEFAQTFSGQCGDNLYWSYQNNTLTISGFGGMYDNRPWGLFVDEIQHVVLPNAITHIGDDAFSDCTGLNEITIPYTVTSIGDYAFAGCRKLVHVNCYAINPPMAETTSFANYNVYLNVPCDNLQDYQLDMVFGSFKYIQCMEADSENVPTDDVVVTPGTNDVTITWPTDENADTYKIEIKRGDVVFCTLTFNKDGMLLNIAFAPSRSGSHPVTYAASTGNGLRFTVTSLDAATTYAYDITTKDVNDNTISTYTGEFTTKSNVSTSVSDIQSPITDCQKLLRNGQLVIVRDGVEYNAQGQIVKE